MLLEPEFDQGKYSVDLIDAVARHFAIEFDTFRKMNIVDFHILLDEWVFHYMTEQEENEYFPRSFEVDGV